jgi:hypothetical protein
VITVVVSSAAYYTVSAIPLCATLLRPDMAIVLWCCLSHEHSRTFSYLLYR